MFLFYGMLLFYKEIVMRKLLLTVGVVLLAVVPVAAQNLDVELKKAVDGLRARFNRTIEVRIEPVTIAGTDTPTAFSQYLQSKIGHFAVNGGVFKVSNASRAVNTPRSPDRAVIGGTYTKRGASVEVALRLTSEADNTVMASVVFTVPLAELEAEGWTLLPPDAKSETDVQEKEVVLADIPTDRPQAAAQPAPQAAPPAAAAQPAPQAAAKGTLVLSAWPHEESGVFYDGDTLTFSVFADKDCYVMVYHIDTSQKMQLIFPNIHDLNNAVKGGTAVKIPQNGSYRFNLHAPFGQDTIIVKAAFRQFPDVDAEMQTPVTDATRETVDRRIRGLSIQATGSGNTRREPDAVTRFTYVVLPAAESRQTLRYARPADPSQFLRDFRATIGEQGGQLNGNATQGSFSGPGFSGTYRTEGGDIVFTLSEERSAATAVRTRGIPKKGYSFTFDRPRDMSAAIRTVRSGIQGKGGSFSGDERAGFFSVSKISGEYTVSNQATVLIIEKPALLPNSLIENEVKKFFGVR
jgi:hypothetical protein